MPTLFSSIKNHTLNAEGPEIIVQFFSAQGMIKEYIATDLLSDQVNNVLHASSTKQVLHGFHGFVVNTSLYDFVVNTVDDYEYIFDARTGAIKSKKYIGGGLLKRWLRNRSLGKP